MEQSVNPVKTIRLDRRTKLGLMAAMVVSMDSTDHAQIIKAVDLAIALEREVERQVSR